MFETRSLDEFYINLVQLDYTRLELFSSYLRFFARIWFRSCKICAETSETRQTWKSRQMPERLGGWRIKHEVSFGYADAADISFLSNYVTTLTLSQLCHNKCHNFVITNVTKTMQKISMVISRNDDDDPIFQKYLCIKL